MKLPKKVLINNIPFKIVKDRKMFGGGSLSYKKSEIRIGMKGMSEREVLENFIHEVAEVSTVERGVRGSKCKPLQAEPEYIFACGHREFEAVINDVSGVIADMMKLD